MSSDGAAVDIDLGDVARTIEAIKNVAAGIQKIATAPGSAFPPNLVADGFRADFPAQLMGYLVNRYLQAHRPGIGFALQTLGVTRLRYRPSAGNRPPYVDYTLDFSSLPKLFSDPRTLLENAFGWGTDDFNYRLLESKVDDLAMALDRRVVTDVMPLSTAKLLEDGAPVPNSLERRRTRIVFFERGRTGGRLAAEVSLFPLPKAGGKKPGFALMPMFNGALSLRTELGPNIAVTITSDLDTQGGIGLMVRPDSGIEMVLGFDKPGAPVHAKGSGRVEVEFARKDKTPFPILGESQGTRLEVVSASGAAGFLVVGGSDVEVFAEAETEGLAFILDTSQGDGFISKVLSGLNTKLEFDLGVGLNYPRGFYFRGTSTLEIQVPAHISLGPGRDPGPHDRGPPSRATAAADRAGRHASRRQLGPLTAVVENIGLTRDVRASARATTATSGRSTSRSRSSRRTASASSIDAGVVKGGGYLFIDADQRRVRRRARAQLRRLPVAQGDRHHHARRCPTARRASRC